MKKFVLTLCLLVLAVNVHAERKFVLVDLLHLKSADFVFDNSAKKQLKNIYKPHCRNGGVAEIELTNTFIFFQVGYAGSPHVHYFVDYKDYGDFWSVFYPCRQQGYCLETQNLTAKVYCAYPIQCIKQ